MPTAAEPGILLANLGTPDAPEAGAVRRYLRQFLSDRRVVDAPRWLWLPILHGIVLRTRPKRSAHAYARIWTPEGSPLLVTTRRIARALSEALGLPVETGMRYGNPSIAEAIARLGGRPFLVLPLFPQYSASTTESVYDAVAAAKPAAAWRRVEDYHDDPGYVGALAASVREVWERGGEPERLLASFHGLPRRYVLRGDPYETQCARTAEALARTLGAEKARVSASFQSRFGREEWIRPYTDETLAGWGSEGTASVDVLCPGFPCDCLETLEEIAMQNRELFESRGGGRFRYIPALNDRPSHIAALAGIARRHLAGWIRA